jgi:hypothetical protein
MLNKQASTMAWVFLNLAQEWNTSADVGCVISVDFSDEECKMADVKLTFL